MSVHFSGKQNQRGVGLIEVLVSLLLLAVAVIGFAALQVKAVSTTNTAVYRTQGMAIAQELAERIRVNYGQTAAYRAADWSVLPVKECLTATCTPAEMVSYDIRVTKQLAAATLPNGDVAMRQCGGTPYMCIYVAWNDTNTKNDGSTNACGTSTGSYASLAADCVIMEVYQ